MQSTWNVISFPVFTFVYDYAMLSNFICGVFTTLKFIFCKGIVKPVIAYSSVASIGLARQGFQLFNFALPKT